jgi:hypothetical protein
VHFSDTATRIHHRDRGNFTVIGAIEHIPNDNVRWTRTVEEQVADMDAL